MLGKKIKAQQQNEKFKATNKTFTTKKGKNNQAANL